jgi:fatty-acyl-CoA synthase
MRGLMMDVPLTLPAIQRRAEALFGDVEVVGRCADRSVHRYSYGEMVRRAKQLAIGLKKLGVGPGTRVATLGWNHHQHLEAYFAVPSVGGVLHTLNLRLHPDELTYIANHARDHLIVVDHNLWPLYEQLRPSTIRHVVLMGPREMAECPPDVIPYEDLIASTNPAEFEWSDVDERDAAALCYTSGTTGQSKGVLYSHRAIAVHCMNWAMVDNVAIGRRDVVLGAPPMFHINGWGLAFLSAMVGAKLVLPNRFLDPESVLELIERERVSVAAGVPTVWFGVMGVLDASPQRYDIRSLQRIATGGSAPPTSLMRAWTERYGVEIIHLWGMTEMTGSGTVSLADDAVGATTDERYRRLARQGIPEPFIEIRARNESGLVPWDGTTMGELEVCGPSVASAYYENAAAGTSFTDDGWFRTGDIVTIDPSGSIELCDRAKDLIKSGGEWISSVALENALMGFPAIAEAAVIAVPHPKWGERPVACIVVRAGETVTADELRVYLAASFAKWMLPDDFQVVDVIPRTSTGKFLKSALRERYRHLYVSEHQDAGLDNVPS